MNPDTTVDALRRVLAELPTIRREGVDSSKFVSWRLRALSMVGRICAPDCGLRKDFEAIEYTLVAAPAATAQAKHDAFLAGLTKAGCALQVILDHGPTRPAAVSPSIVDRVVGICDRFPRVVKELGDRYDGRAAVAIDDEYDVQDLMRALLATHFDDIRPEEWIEPTAGSPSRVDFIVVEEGSQVALELKMWRPTMTQGSLVDQIAKARVRYEKNTDCRDLIVFVYDPKHEVGNPTRFEKDLSTQSRDRASAFRVHVLVRPKP